MMINLLETINQLSVVLLLLCTFFYYWHLKRNKKQRKLTTFEFWMFFTIKLAIFVGAGSYVLLFLDRN
ncbi:hypothetical protein ACTQ5K_13855 [Niallia sp. Sow4_A1]|uniref:hypothetical protein n=2 Tax=Bacillales TaxID=1385 RepID=UPI0004E1A12B|nr:MULTISPECIES: hypothetical protein [Bacillaceae]MCF2648986.1 hypothetical protein [Niallia circulans]MCM3363711.1 hypothetical protein [Niallia sp. MER TA 168]CAI9391180.1 hypothetical protein BACSP_02918 [Bacillus sp. T2.9-1]